MRVAGAVIFFAALAGSLPAAAAEGLLPGGPAGVSQAQERSYRWVYISGGAVVVAGVAILASKSSSVSTTLKISTPRDQITSVIVTDTSVVSTGTH